ncbi:hypothetical protein AVEN_191595-1 [Araneus ventricosus]|uniref:Uncharacterized protein n=1 Tax=Araneus ventricosus TaxID=182803 RepID=A0A4Y2P8L0_ARAVE|nr:hypothetical protein AVEN_191595-1 [Araneus ventricosus]
MLCIRQMSSKRLVNSSLTLRLGLSASGISEIHMLVLSLLVNTDANSGSSHLQSLSGHPHFGYKETVNFILSLRGRAIGTSFLLGHPDCFVILGGFAVSPFCDIISLRKNPWIKFSNPLGYDHSIRLFSLPAVCRSPRISRRFSF